MNVRLRQRWRKAQALVRLGISPERYDFYGLSGPAASREDVLAFLTQSQWAAASPCLHDELWKPVLRNKWLTHLHFAHAGVPVPKLYGIYDTGAGRTAEGAPLGTAEELRAWLLRVQPRSLVIKPVGGSRGQRVLVLSEMQYESGSPQGVTSGGAFMTFEELAHHVDEVLAVDRVDRPGYLLQERIQQHSFLERIAPYATNTFRVVTFVGRTGRVAIHGAVLRLGRRGSMADNWAGGGLAVAVDADTGVLGEGAFELKYGGGRTRAHPDSGTSFYGLQVPRWEDVLEVSSRAARATPHLRSVGWDIALAEDGPVLIEGNTNWDVALMQAVGGGVLRPEVREHFAAFGATFPERDLPPVTLAGIRRLSPYVRALMRRALR